MSTASIERPHASPARSPARGGGDPVLRRRRHDPRGRGLGDRAGALRARDRQRRLDRPRDARGARGAGRRGTPGDPPAQPRHRGGAHDRRVRPPARRTCSRSTRTTPCSPERWRRSRTRSRRARGWRRRGGASRLFGDVERRERSRAATLDPWRITYFNNIPYASLMRREPLLAVGGWSLPGRVPGLGPLDGARRGGLRRHGRRRPGPATTACTADASSRAAPPSMPSATRPSRAATSACSPSAAATGGAPASPGACGVGLPLAAAIPGLPQRQRHRLFTLADTPREALDHARPAGSRR